MDQLKTVELSFNFLSFSYHISHPSANPVDFILKLYSDSELFLLLYTTATNLNQATWFLTQVTKQNISYFSLILSRKFTQ